MKRIIYTAIVKRNNESPTRRIVVFCNKSNTLSYKLLEVQTGLEYNGRMTLTNRILPIHFNEVFGNDGKYPKSIFDDLFSDCFIILESTVY